MPVSIFYDPIPVKEGGFKKGARFNKKDLKAMLAMAHFSLDTVLNIKGELYLVVSSTAVHQITGVEKQTIKFISELS